MLSAQAKKVKAAFPPKSRSFLSELSAIVESRLAWESQCEPIDLSTPRESTIKPFYYLLNPAATQAAILYTHGGGYTEGSARTHHHICQAIAGVTDACVYNVEYSLAPEATYPIAVNELCDLYHRIKDKYNAIYFIGDSAGAGLVMQAMMKLTESKETTGVAGIVLISPWLDLQVDKHKDSLRDGADLLVSYEALKGCAGLYLAGQDAADPAISPSFAKDRSFPRTLILAGSDEILLDDVFEFYENNKNTTEIELAIYEGMWHVWVGWIDLEESQRAIQQIGDFVKRTS